MKKPGSRKFFLWVLEVTLVWFLLYMGFDPLNAMLIGGVAYAAVWILNKQEEDEYEIYGGDSNETRS